MNFFARKPKQPHAGSPRGLSAREHVPTETRREPETAEAVKSRKNTRLARKPEVIAVTSPRLYVGNLSFQATDADLLDLFNGVGTVVSAEVVSHPHTQKSKGFAFVQMQTTEEAVRAVDQLHDQEFLGRKLFVSGAKNPTPDDQDRPESVSHPI